jgi:tetratricopeptide (TPR) repeat protein
MREGRSEPELRELLDGFPPPWEHADGLLRVLALSAEAPDSLVNEVDRALCRGGVAPEVVEALRSDLAERPVPLPEDVDGWRSWLGAVEEVGLAHRALGRLYQSRARNDRLRVILQDALGRYGKTFKALAIRSLLAGEAERAGRTGMEIEPWNWLRGGRLGEALRRDSGLLPLAMASWFSGLLHSEDAEDLRRRVTHDNRVRDACRDYLRKLTATLHVTRWNPEWSLDVAANDQELDQAERLFDIALPHCGSRLDVRHHTAGTWWSIADGMRTSELVTWDTGCHVWRDPLLGEFETSIHAEKPSPEADVWHGLVSLRRLVHRELPGRGRDVALALARDLASGAMGDALRRGREAFEVADDVPPALQHLVAHAVDARLVLSDAMMRLSEAQVDVRTLGKLVREADEVHRPDGPALHLLDDRTYEDIVGETELDEHEWWGARARLDRLVPPGAVEGLLQDTKRPAVGDSRGKVAAFRRRRQAIGEAQPRVRLAAATEDLAAQIRGLATGQRIGERLADVLPALRALPCPWLHSDIRAAVASLHQHASGANVPVRELATPGPGRVAILLCEEDTGQGFVAELEVWLDEQHDSNALWTKAPQLERHARRVIRSAFKAAASLTATGAAPWDLSQHRLRLKPPVQFPLEDTSLEIDGASLGLPAVLAFASLWSDTVVAGDIVATGALRGGSLAPVSGVTSKARRIVELAGHDRLRLLCHPVNVAEAEGIGEGVVTLAEALQSCGIDLGRMDSTRMGSVRERERVLDQLVRDAQEQNLTRADERGSWLEIADRMSRLVASLDGAPGVSCDLDEARCHASLAYTHAGEVEDAVQLLRTVGNLESRALPLRALHAIGQLNVDIDHDDLDSEAARASFGNLESLVGELRKRDDERQLGRALGTLGRARMHQHRLQNALLLLEEAVERHTTDEHLRYELARSRVYLAMALRMAGRPEDGLTQLRQAEDELTRYTLPVSPEYATATTMWVWYERARVLVALGRFEEALEDTARAQKQCEYVWWPQIGILRTRAWALRSLLREREADICVDRMRVVQHQLGPRGGAHRALIEGLIAEAQGDATDCGIVY